MLLALKHEDLNLDSQLPYKEPGKAASAYNPHAMEAETLRLPELTGQTLSRK